MKTLAEVSVGFVGVGTMSAAIAQGLATMPHPPRAIHLSPRNALKARRLEQAFPHLVRVATSNQQVLDDSDLVFIGLLPAAVEEVTTSLTFQSTHTVCSLVSTASLESITRWCAPAETVARAIPLPAVAHHRGTTILTPPLPLITAAFDALGSAVAVESEAQMRKMMAVTCLMGQLYEQQRVTQRWMEDEGVPAELASRYIGAIFHTITGDSMDATSTTFGDLVDEQTPGGLNEQVVRELREAGSCQAMRDALEGCSARIEGRQRKTT